MKKTMGALAACLAMPAAMAGTITFNFNPAQLIGKLLHPSPPASQPVSRSVAQQPAQATVDAASGGQPSRGEPSGAGGSFGMVAGTWLIANGKQCAVVDGYGDVKSIAPGSSPALVRKFIDSLLSTHVGSQFGNVEPDPVCHMTAFSMHGSRVRATEQCAQGQGRDGRTVVGHYVIAMNAAGTRGIVEEHEVSTESGKLDYRGQIDLYSTNPRAQPPHQMGCLGDVLGNGMM